MDKRYCYFLSYVFLLAEYVKRKNLWKKFIETKAKEQQRQYGAKDCPCCQATRPEHMSWYQLRDQVLRNTVFVKSLAVVWIQQTTRRRVCQQFWKVVLDLVDNLFACWLWCDNANQQKGWTPLSRSIVVCVDAFWLLSSLAFVKIQILSRHVA